MKEEKNLQKQLFVRWKDWFPILMTAITAGLISSFARQRPASKETSMAIVILGGLITSTALI